MSRRIAISGTHGSGKTTLAYRIVAELKARHVNAGVTEEAARYSLYLASGLVSPEGQLDLLGRQISLEMEAERKYDLVICDRTVADILAYTKIFCASHSGTIHQAYLAATEAFVAAYLPTYDRIFVTTTFYDPRHVTDAIRPKNIELQEQAARQIRDELMRFHPRVQLLPNDDPLQFLLATLLS